MTTAVTIAVTMTMTNLFRSAHVVYHNHAVKLKLQIKASKFKQKRVCACECVSSPSRCLARLIGIEQLRN